MMFLQARNVRRQQVHRLRAPSASVDLDGSWQRRAESDMPPGLQKKHHKAKGSKHEKHPAKGRW
jgi:hypothetical protein